jgi:hypothetical protein
MVKYTLVAYVVWYKLAALGTLATLWYKLATLWLCGVRVVYACCIGYTVGTWCGTSGLHLLHCGYVVWYKLAALGTLAILATWVWYKPVAAL